MVALTTSVPFFLSAPPPGLCQQVDMFTCLPPEEWSSPLTFCSCLPPVLSLSIHRTAGEGLSTCSVYPLLPQSIFLRSFPRQPSCTHQGGWTRLPDPTAHFPPSSLIHPGLLMRRVHPGDWTPFTSSTPTSWDISLSPLCLSSCGSLFLLPTALSATLHGLP